MGEGGFTEYIAISVPILIDKRLKFITKTCKRSMNDCKKKEGAAAGHLLPV
jgi:hypothetical protein